MTLRLRTFGAVCLERDGAALGGAPARRRQLALLAYLAANGDGPVTRDKLLALLWPERAEHSSRHSLSQLLYALRQELPPESLVASADEVRLDPSRLGSDVRDFQEAIRNRAYQRAVELYQGAFLDGFFVDDADEFERWAESERSRLASAYGGALDRLAQHAAAAGDHFRTVDWLLRKAELNRADAEIAARLIEAMMAVGDRTGALRQAQLYEAYVRDELGDEPDARVASLASKLPPVRSIAEVPSATPTVTTAPISVVAEPPSARMPHSRMWLFAGGFTVLALMLALVWPRTIDTAAKSNGRLTVVLMGDLAGPDTVLAMAVREALRAELAVAESITQISELRAREIQLLMGEAGVGPLRETRLLEVAQRGGAHIAVTGSAAPLGTGAQLLVQLIEPANGEIVKTIPQRAANMDDVVPAVAAIGRSLRAAISTIPADTAVRPLPAVSTSSLPALKSYALARRAATIGERDSAVAHAERAVMHDSMFALAHFLAGDLLWFLDRQSHAEAHLTRANALSARIPLRERLAVRARYEQIVMDRPDSAMVYWDMLRDLAPNDPIAYEARAWTLRSLGRYEEAALSAERALELDPSARLPNATNALLSYLSTGDTTNALAAARRWPAAGAEAEFNAALVRDDLPAAFAIANRASALGNVRLHESYLIAGDLPRARVHFPSAWGTVPATHFPRAHIVQGGMELCLTGNRALASQHARTAFEWLREQDLSAPGLGRLAERIGDLAAHAGDLSTVEALSELVRRRDGGRGLPSYVLAQRTLDAARAYARGDYREAARLAEIARYGVYFSRSLNTIVRLEADALREAGEPARAKTLYDLIEHHQIADGDHWSWIVLRAMTRKCGLK